MKKQGLLKLIGTISMVLTLAGLPFEVAHSKSVSTSKPSNANPIVLKTALLVKRDHPVNYSMTWLAEQVEKRSNGKLIIKILGGPEAIPSFEQTDAILRGVIDIYWTGSAYIQAAWPEAIVFPLSRITPSEERKQGAFDLLQESSKKRGLFYLGRTLYPRGYYMYLNVRVKIPEDLRGLKIRGAPIYTRFHKALGVSMVTTPFREVYTAMERGVIDGYCWPPSICQYRLHEVTKYIIHHSFYGANSLFAMNLDRWNQLPADLQRLLQEAVEEQETGLEQKWQGMWNEELKDIKAGGVEFIEFSPNDAERYVNLAYDEAWKEVLEKSPEYSERLKELMIP